MDSPRSWIILDLEATCWEKGSRRERMETIEMGAVRLRGEGLAEAGEFSRFVRPVAEPRLSAFCTGLTGIRQTDVDPAAAFPEVFAEFLAWVGPGDIVLASWGDYDRNQLERDCSRHGIPRPGLLDSHLNLKELFARRHSRRPGGLRKALHILGLEFEGRPHRGIDDARNIARVARHLLGRGSTPRTLEES